MVKSKKVKCLITKQEKNLIINSNISVERPKLKEVLSKFNNRIELKDLGKIKNIDEGIYKLIKTRDAVEAMRDDASIEWYQAEAKGKIRKPCELCGCKKSEEKFVIANKVTEAKLLVGSSCIDKFPKMDSTLYGIPIKQFAKYSKSNPEKLDRIIKFNELYEGGQSVISDWKQRYNNFEIIFPKDYDEEFNNIVSKGRKIYKGYINGVLNDDKVKGFKKCIDDFNYLYERKCLKFYEDNKNDKYICTKKMVALLENDGLHTTLSYIKNDGKIREDLAKYVYHSDFVSRFKDEIKNIFSGYNLKLEKIDNQLVRFSYKYNRFNPISLETSIKNFTINYSEIFYGAKKFDIEQIFKNIRLNMDYVNVYEFIGIIENILNGTGYYLEFNEDLYSKKIVELYNMSLNTYVELGIQHVLTQWVQVLYLTQKDAKQFILDYINEIKTWKDKKDKKKYSVGNISAIWSND